MDEQEERQEHERAPRGNPVVVLVMVAVVGWALYVVLGHVGNTARGGGDLPPPQLKHQDLGPMDLNWSVKQLDGPEMDMSSIKGKVAVVNFWEYWCPPCRAEIGSIQRLHEAVKDDGILVLPVFQQDPAATRALLKSLNITMPVYQLVGSLPDDVAPEYIPTTYIIDPKGEVVFRDTGAANWADPSVMTFLRGLKAK